MRLYLIPLILLLLCTLGMRAEGYVIYPIPHDQELQPDSLRLGRTIRIVADPSIDPATIQRARTVLQEHGFGVRHEGRAQAGTTTLVLRTAIGTATLPAHYVSTLTMPRKYDRHMIEVDDTGITITGEDTDAVFHALASLEQMLEQSHLPYLRHVVIRDYADSQSRGIVEGYYGFPYSIQTKKELLRFMMRYKMNTYMYGGKSDPYHSRYWRAPYPTDITPEQERGGWLTQQMIGEIAELSTETKVRFIWAIHPGHSFLADSSVVSDVMHKFGLMHQLGIRQFALFIDDVGVPTEEVEMQLTADRVIALQAAIDARWDSTHTPARDRVRPLHYVPQLYCSAFARDDAQRIAYMRIMSQIPDRVTVYTTGQHVWSVPNSEHTIQMAHELGRPMAWWWNYPCNDNADTYIYTKDMYSNFVDLPAINSDATLPSHLEKNLGIVANPMQQGMIARGALFSVADYAWNNSSFDPDKSWEASFGAMISDPKLRAAYRYIAPYLSPSEPTEIMRAIADYRWTMTTDQPRADELRTLLLRIVEEAQTLQQLHSSAVESDRLLYSDLSPWLLRLQTQAVATLTLMDVMAMTKTKPDQARQLYTTAQQMIRDLDTKAEYTVQALEGMGEGIGTYTYETELSTTKLTPLLNELYRRCSIRLQAD